MKFIRNSLILLSFIMLASGLLFSVSEKAAAQDANFLVEVQANEEPPQNDPCIAYIQPFLLSPDEAPQTTPSPAPTQGQGPTPAGPATFADAEFTINPPMECITEQLRYVEISFHGLTRNQGGYRICTGSEICLATDPSQPGVPDFFVDLINAPGETDANGTITIPVCGDGEKKIKTGCGGNDNWFHGGNVYYVSIGTQDNGIYKPAARGGFYVSRYYPDVVISPNSNLTTETGSINVSISGERPGGTNRNNYQVIMTGGENNYADGKCINSGQNVTFSGLDRVGTYNIYISDRINEPSTGSLAGGILQGITNPVSLLPDGLPFIGGGEAWENLYQNLADRCQGGFTYFQITCNITNPDVEGKGSCEDPHDGADPEGVEYKAFLEQLSRFNNIFGTSMSFPCGDGTRSSAVALGGCKTINTALGPIEATPEGLVRIIFGFVLTLASFGAIIVIIYAGYEFMISRGDKEKLQNARERITAAIVGLLFIIFSLVILEIIGVDILAIPGLGR